MAAITKTAAMDIPIIIFFLFLTFDITISSKVLLAISYYINVKKLSLRFHFCTKIVTVSVRKS